MRRLVVQQNDTLGWDVLDPEDGANPLYRGDRIRAEGFARRLFQADGGTVTVTGLGAMPLSEYVVKPSGHAPRPAPVENTGSRRRERRQSWPAWGQEQPRR